MSVKPILFNTDMVRAILGGRKTVTRRLVDIDISNQFDLEVDGTVICYIDQSTGDSHNHINLCRYHPGDILYVRETFGNWCLEYPESNATYYQYRADYPDGARTYMYDERNECDLPKWHPSIHMPKEAARIWLKVTGVRVERLLRMSHEAARQEGIHYCESPDGFTWKTETDMNCCYVTPSGAFEALWNSTVNKAAIGRYGWESNPWVWVIEFERCEKPEGQLEEDKWKG